MRIRGLSELQISSTANEEHLGELSDRQRLLLQCVDQLIEHIFIGDDTWDAARAHFSELEMMDVVFACGIAYMQSIFMKSLQVQLEEGCDIHSVFH